MALKTIADARRALARLTNYERTRADGPRAFDLSRPRGLLARLGGPDRRMGAPVVQIAGSKGKGSTARFLDAILRADGRRTGRYLSPHLESELERIAIDGEPIAERAFAAAVERTIAAVDGETTFFEALLGAACLHFAEAGTGAVILEVGLGGRLDATTAVPTTHTIITSIGLEHTEILGPTLADVAREKAGTIRPGVPVWSGVAGDAGAAIEAIARERGAPYTYVPPPPNVVADERGVSFDGFTLGVLGRHQAHNAALAVAVARALGIDDVTIARGLADARQPGCCELRGRTLLDGAHTTESVEATITAVRDHFPGVRPTLVLALARDKDVDAIAARLTPAVDAVFCTCADEKRGRTADALAAHPAWEGRATAVADPAAAWRRAREATNGLILVTGSLYLAGALRALAK